MFIGPLFATVASSLLKSQTPRCEKKNSIIVRKYMERKRKLVFIVFCPSHGPVKLSSHVIKFGKFLLSLKILLFNNNPLYFIFKITY